MKRKPARPTPERNRIVPPSIGLVAALVVLGIWLWQGSMSNSRATVAADLPMPPGGAWSVIAAILGALVLSALYAASETALDLLKPMHLKVNKERSGAKSLRLKWLIEHRAGLVAASILGRQAMKLVLVFLGLMLAQQLVAKREGDAVSYGSMLLYGLLLVIPLGILSLALDLIPKSIATMHPAREALRLHRFMVGSWAVFGLPAGLVLGLASLVTARFGGRASFELNPVEEEIKTIVEEAEGSGEIAVDERELLHSVFDFTDTVAREIMTPRVDLDAKPVDSDPKDVVAVIHQTGHSRIPLFEETDDRIVGIVHAKDLLMAAANGQAIDLRGLMRPALFVPENKSLHELLRDMRQSRTQMAIVQDEFGGTAGIVTIEDIVEELVGDIVDEYDVEEPAIQEQAGVYLVGGKTHMDDLNAALGTDLEAGAFDTIGGFVFGLFGRQPKLGESVENEGWKFCVVETDGRRVAKLRIERNPVAIGDPGHRPGA